MESASEGSRPRELFEDELEELELEYEKDKVCTMSSREVLSKCF